MNLVDKLQARIREKRARIVVIGDTMVDRWVHGHIAECQDGCPKFVQDEVVETPGGAANAALCLQHWDVNTSLYGYANNDCPVKTRYVEGGKIMFRADDESLPSERENYQWARDLALEMVQHADAVLLSDYDKGFLTPEFIRGVADLCGGRGVPCVADCKREPSVYIGCIWKGNQEWRDKYFGAGDVVTYGASSPIVHGDDIGLRLEPVECINHVGAGDCFAAHLTLALAYGFSLKEAAALAHSAGRVYVQHPHNRAPHPSEIRAVGLK